MKCAKWAVQQLKKKHDKPFFMGVGFYRPHVPMYASKKWFDMHPKEKVQLPLVQKNDLMDLSQYAIDLTNLKHVSPTHKWVTGAGQWQHAVQSYLASVTFADHCLGLVLDALESSDYADNTIIALFSDHGFHLGEKERWARPFGKMEPECPLSFRLPASGTIRKATDPPNSSTFSQLCSNWLDCLRTPVRKGKAWFPS